MNEKPALYLYNTLSRKKEPFRPAAEGEARIYTCGPTVYDFAHIGNLRAYIFMDSLRRVLKYNGYKLLHVMNITDVGHLVSDEDYGEDKMIKGARERNMTPWEIAAEFTRIFMEDMAALNIEKTEIVSKATEHIPQMLEMVEALADKGYGYELSDGIYFDISKFGGYGRLSGLNLDEQKAGARIEVNAEKRHPADFALWIKAPKGHIMKWDSRWGDGYPGWHIECSAMSIHYLGDRIDIHTGGVDHIPIHHENEIAQSDAYTGKSVVNFWMHNEFVLVDNGKMSKSLRNTYTAKDLRDRGFNPLAYKYFCLNGHYRSKLNFTWDALRSAAVAYRRMIDGVLEHKNAGTAGEAGPDSSYIDNMRRNFCEAINDDLNIPKALGIAWQLIRSPVKAGAVYDLIVEMDGVFGLGIKDAVEAAQRAGGENAAAGSGEGATPSEGAASKCENNAFRNTDIPQDILELVKERDAARSAKDWKRSDELRDLIKEKGYAVADSKQGARITAI